MVTTNPFAELTVLLPPFAMQAYVVLMVFAVAIGTLFDIRHKRSAEYFLRARAKSKEAATRRLNGSDTFTLFAKFMLIDVASAGEFCNPMRRISHVLMFYGFLLYLVTTLVLVFGYMTPGTQAPAAWPVLWNIGALMVMVGGYWFFFFIRVDVAKERQSPFRLKRADLFIVSLLASVTLALVWEIVQFAGYPTATRIVFGIYILFTTLLFVGVPWSKFAHMFYKPAAAFQKRMEQANGASDLPSPTGRYEGR
ncbi:MAG TPA: adenylyl-sulfate reductase [Parasulfuritortus sp.]